MKQLTASHATLNNRVIMPMAGLGVYQIPPGQATQNAVSCALETGYRLIDTAKYYDNEKDVGRAISRSGVSRTEIFVTTKLWNDDHGFDAALHAFDKSLSTLQLGYLDLYLIHWPVKDRSAQQWGRVTKTFRRFVPKRQTL